MEQLSLILNLQWMQFKNSLRTRGGQLELAARILIAAVVLLFDLGIAAVLAVLTAFLYGKPYLQPVLTYVFCGMTFFWVVLPLLTSSFSIGLDPARFRLYPISTRTLFALDLFAGLISPRALSEYLPLAGIVAGAAFASPSAAPAAALSVLIFILFNGAFLIYLRGLIEKFFSNRRRKEIFILIATLGMTVAFLMPQVYLNRELRGMKKGDRPQPSQSADSPFDQIKPILETSKYFAWTPPGLAARAIAGGPESSAIDRAAALFGGLLFAAAALGLSYAKQQDKYYGRPSYWSKLLKRFRADAPRRNIVAPERLQTETASENRFEAASAWLTPASRAVFEKEIKYFYRSPRTLLIFISSILVSLVIGYPSVARGTASGSEYKEFLLAGIGFYSLVVISQIVNNSFCFDHRGTKLFFYVPVRGKDVLIGKNLAAALAILLQAVLVAIFFQTFFSIQPLRALVNMGFIISIGFLFMLAVGNYMSVAFPKTIDFSRMGGSAYSGAAVLTTILTQIVIAALTAIGPVLKWLTKSNQVMYAAFAIELIVAAVVYLALLEGAGRLLERSAEKFLATVSKES